LPNLLEILRIHASPGVLRETFSLLNILVDRPYSEKVVEQICEDEGITALLIVVASHKRYAKLISVAIPIFRFITLKSDLRKKELIDLGGLHLLNQVYQGLLFQLWISDSTNYLFILRQLLVDLMKIANPEKEIGPRDTPESIDKLIVAENLPAFKMNLEGMHKTEKNKLRREAKKQRKRIRGYNNKKKNKPEKVEPGKVVRGKVGAKKSQEKKGAVEIDAEEVRVSKVKIGKTAWKTQTVPKYVFTQNSFSFLPTE